MSGDQGSGKFRPMSEVSHGPKFPAARGNRRDFPETKEEKEEEETDDYLCDPIRTFLNV